MLSESSDSKILVDPSGFSRWFRANLSSFLTLVLILGLVVLSSNLMGLYKRNHFSPYTQNVLSLPGNTAQGKAIFTMNCAVCHGLLADGKVGPSLKHVALRKSPSLLIEQVISGKTPPMPQFQPDPQVMADLLSYLETL